MIEIRCVTFEERHRSPHAKGAQFTELAQSDFQEGEGDSEQHGRGQVHHQERAWNQTKYFLINVVNIHYRCTATRNCVIIDNMHMHNFRWDQLDAFFSMRKRQFYSSCIAFRHALVKKIRKLSASNKNIKSVKYKKKIGEGGLELLRGTQCRSGLKY